MGEIADQIIDGEICQICCCPLQDEQGYPVTCNECDKNSDIPLWSQEDGVASE